MQRAISLAILVGLVVLLAILFYQVMIGFLLPLFLAALLAILFQPLHQWIVRVFRGYNGLAAAATTILILLIVLAPLGFVVFRAAREATAILSRSHGPQFDRQTLDRIVDNLNQRFSLDLSPKELMQVASAKAQDWFGPLAAKTPGFLGGLLINCLVTVLGLYYFLADGTQLTASAMRLLPLDQKYQQQLVGKFVEMSRAVTSASLLAALTQGILLGIAYYFAGLSGMFLLTILTMLASFVPLIGSSVVWGSCCVWLFFDDKATAAMLLLVWSGIVVVVADNFVKPMVLHGQSKLHPLLALLSVLGGVQVLGPLGIFFGPMAVAFLQAGLTMLNTELNALPAELSAAGEPLGQDARAARADAAPAKSRHARQRKKG
ncbi:MAG TPA: AI-2E family transporter [Pirellulales bacterium]|nr:AI-2E family transporter [Pirellulales bacterium]